ncbi:bifunctional ThiF-MoeB-HesA family/Ubiquitin-activating enzyme/THIF-type NAD-FAD binding fold [Babesia duncani]|uniref:Bifunctional ThiF-MoeB-HesA family/Ubiquitin-activating enzyme/THIF-type NAD-FAD binding fold n=1 Tax=Babesia duncani TaxID=323732 RepID=A0AAD9UQN1_9APIC|nr:bifunctional ThiF-MoeB-HesA family/Ubiquitin-activating enzyme/THIF-type NAD-FAD binding fold [Babesia duncani]
MNENVEQFRRSIESLNNSQSPSSGCLESNFKFLDCSDEELLIQRPRWSGFFKDLKPFQSACPNRTQSFCSCMRSEDAERYGAQLIALHGIEREKSGVHMANGIASCAVLVIGAGGLGSPVLMYLAAGGIGLIGVMDGDVVEVSNLHRQPIHDESNVGMNKAKSAKQRMQKINNGARVIAYEYYLSETSVDVLCQYDIIVDATDNPQTRCVFVCLKYPGT